MPVRRSPWQARHRLDLGFLKFWNITRKTLTLVADERDRPDVKRRRGRWKRLRDKADPCKPVFIDETWMKTNMSLSRGWSPKGHKVRGPAPFGRWNTANIHRRSAA